MIALQPPQPAVDARVLVQLGAWRTRLKAEETVRQAQRLARDPPPLRVVAAQVAGRAWWRVVAGPVSPSDAGALCLKLSGSDAPCWTRPLRSTGAP